MNNSDKPGKKEIIRTIANIISSDEGTLLLFTDGTSSLIPAGRFKINPKP